MARFRFCACGGHGTVTRLWLYRNRCLPNPDAAWRRRWQPPVSEDAEAA